MKQRIIAGWMLLVLAGLAPAADPPPAADPAGFELTAKEQAFLAAHPEIRVGIRSDWPPLDFLDAAGQPDGIGAEILAEMNQLLGGVLRIQGGTYAEILRKAQARDLDAVMDVTPRPDREEFLGFTRPYLDIPQVLVGKRESRYYPTAKSLTGHSVALGKGADLIPWFQDNYPKVRIRQYDTVREALDAVARGQADVYAGNRAVALYLLERDLLTNLHLQGRLDAPAALALGVRADWPGACELLDRALEAVLRRHGRRIFARWFDEISQLGRPFQPGPAEQAWLAQHPVIRIGIVNNCPPMDFVDEAGQPAGIGMDFIHLLNKRLDGRIEAVPGAWSNLYAAVRAGRLDAMMDYVPGPEGDAVLLATKPYAVIPHVIVGRRGEEFFDSLESLKGRRVAVEAGSFAAAHLRARRAGLALEEFPDVRAALVAVSAGRADAYLGNRAAAIWTIGRELLSNLQVQGAFSETATVNAIGVNRGDPELARLLEAALVSLSQTAVQEVFARWGGLGQNRRSDLAWIRLTPEEKQWLDDHPLILVGSNPRWAPVEFIDRDGVPRGISRDYLDQFGRALGVNFRHVQITSWRQAQAKLRDGEVDLLSCLNKASARKADYVFTPPYLSLQTAIFTRQDAPFTGNLAEFKDRAVAIIMGYGLAEFLVSQSPGIRLEDAKDVPQALKMLEAGKVDAFVGPLLITSHYLQQGGHTRIKVVGETSFVYQPAFAGRKEWQVLVDILDKLMEGIGETERNAITRKWLSVTFEQQIDYRKLYQIGGGALALLAVFVYWNRRLSSEIRRRRIVEASLLKSEDNLVAANKELEAFSYSVSHDLRAPLRHISGFVQLLQAQAQGQLADSGRHYLEIIAGASKKMGELIDDLLSFSRTGRAQMRLETVPLGLLVEECRRELEPEQRGRTIEWEVGPLPAVQADRALLRQVLANLLGNAIKYTRNRPVARIEVSARQEQGEIVVCIRDNGAGFDMQYANKLFGVFQRLHSETEFEGTGIGLANVRRIVVRHGGRTWAEGQVDQGAAFYFTLPVSPAQTA